MPVRICVLSLDRNGWFSLTSRTLAASCRDMVSFDFVFFPLTEPAAPPLEARLIRASVVLLRGESFEVEAEAVEVKDRGLVELRKRRAVGLNDMVGGLI